MPDNEYSTLLFDVRNNVGYITLNRPEAANALNAELAHDLMEVSLRCEEDPSVRGGQTLLCGWRPQELRRPAQRDAADLSEKGHLSPAQGDLALQSNEGAGGARDPGRGGRRRDGSRMRGRYRDRGGVGAIHYGLYTRWAHARRVFDLLSAAYRGAKARDGLDAHQPRALSPRGLRVGYRDPRGARRRADGNCGRTGERLRAGPDARVPGRETPVR